jgi:hypothetical protein
VRRAGVGGTQRHRDTRLDTVAPEDQGGTRGAYPRRTLDPYPADAKCELSVTGQAADLRSKLVQKSATAIVKLDLDSAVESAPTPRMSDTRVADLLVLQVVPFYVFWCSTCAAQDSPRVRLVLHRRAGSPKLRSFQFPPEVVGEVPDSEFTPCCSPGITT